MLLLDLPPGTGDVAISVGQLLPHAEVLVVTTPQPAAADVAERSGVVARQTGQRVIGVIENMAGLAQPDGTILELFGSGGGAEVAARLSVGQDDPVPLLASVPLSVAAARRRRRRRPDRGDRPATIRPRWRSARSRPGSPRAAAASPAASSALRPLTLTLHSTGSARLRRRQRGSTIRARSSMSRRSVSACGNASISARKGAIRSGSRALAAPSPARRRPGRSA